VSLLFPSLSQPGDGALRRSTGHDPRQRAEQRNLWIAGSSGRPHRRD
jgi:hypothetical protein